MKDLFSKTIVLITGVAAFFGISLATASASTIPPTSKLEISGKSVLYLEHGKYINNDNLTSISWHESHQSHESHRSHYSHYSHRSGY